MDKQQRVIWSSMIDYDEWREDLESEYPELTDDERIDIATEINDEYLEDERLNLDIELSQPIVVIADLGFWNGRVNGYKEIKSKNIKDCLDSGDDFITWFVDDNGDLRGIGHHHDGTNRYLYRVYKDNVSEEEIAEFLKKIYAGEVQRCDIESVTNRLGDVIGEVYGWKF